MHPFNVRAHATRAPRSLTPLALAAAALLLAACGGGSGDSAGGSGTPNSAP